MRRPVDLAVISDVHLGTYGCHAEELIRYLKSIEPKVLVLNGDIMDCWQFRKGYFPASHLEVIRQFTRFAAKGTPVFYLTGNHDDLFRRFTDLALGNFHLRDQLVLTVGGEKVLFFHGDIFDASIRHARWLAKLGGRGYDWLIRLNRLINAVLLRMGRPRVSFSHKIKKSVKKAVKFVSDFEQGAAELGIAQGCSTVVCGHIHQPAMRQLQGSKKGGSIRYLNSGDWVEHLSALEYHSGDWHLWHYEQQMPEIFSNAGNTPLEPLQEGNTLGWKAAAEPWVAQEMARETAFNHLDQLASLQLLLERERRALKGKLPPSFMD
ncbi:MAG: UDP-2,3-diacylglucosamine diphosphatase [Bacteroidetes bacterium]|nr:UDP-2,3-diacylglucosamine diphosphatase [Bacteroidota bacterium]